MGSLVHRGKLRPGTDETGAVAIIVALFSVVLFGFAALVVDIGHADDVHLQGQSAVDAASLAGVRVLANGGSDAAVVSAVKSYVDQNMGITAADWAGCQDPATLGPQIDTDVTTDTCISTLTSSIPGVASFQVRVKLPTQHVPATFGGLFGVSSIGISPIAQALSGQPLPPECGPCDPALDESTGQPHAQAAPTGLPAPIRAMLPDPTLTSTEPGYVPPAGPLDPNGTGCPTTPGLFTQTAFPTGVTIAPNPAIPVACTLHPGLYVFDNVNLDVAAAGSLASTVAGTPVDPSDPPAGTGVTLVFYGTGTLSVEGHIGTLDPDSGQRDPLIASKPAVVWQPGQPIPGVAIVLDQFGSPPTPTSLDCVVAPTTRCFSLGDDFTITGSVYALDGQTTWTTNSGDCMPLTSTCVVHDEDNSQSVLATTATAFSDPDPGSGIGRIPTVATDHPMAEPPPSPPHLVK